MRDAEAEPGQDLLAEARGAVRVIERFIHRELSKPEGGRVERARQLQRLAVGLRRGLDSWKE